MIIPRPHRSLLSRIRSCDLIGAAIAAVLVFVSASASTTSPPTALDRYVHAPDPAYSWKIANTLETDAAKVFLVEMTSQSWLTTNEVDRPLWKHWIFIVRPKQVRHETALLFIGGGGNNRPAPKAPDGNLLAIAAATHSVVAELRMVPNQPLTFVGDGHARTEDELIAYSWDRFLRTGDDRWPARLPMTKSAVRAMDTITAVCASPDAGEIKVDRFFVAGGSKRGWTTWTTAAVDPRVVAIAPAVIDCLNLEQSFIHHFECYGFYAPAVGDYETQGIMAWQGTPEYRKLLEIEEPYSYRTRFTMPKFILNATGDQFFLPDSSQFYFDSLPGVKYLRYVPNADHSLRDSDAWETIAASYHAILNRASLPEFTWTNRADLAIGANLASIEVRAKTAPAAVKLWMAANLNARDFRVETLGRAWGSVDIAPSADGAYLANVSAPPKGWTAFLIELTFPPLPGATTPLKFTTNVRVVPDTKPFHYQKPDKHP